jgi:hypothetical protein
MRIFYLAAIFTGFAASPLCAKDGAYVMGFGAHSCAEIGQLYKQFPKNVPSSVTDWGLGYLSAVNQWISDDPPHAFRDLEKSNDKLWPYVASYCDRHPLSTVHNAILMYYQNLPIIKDEPNN